MHNDDHTQETWMLVWWWTGWRRGGKKKLRRCWGKQGWAWAFGSFASGACTVFWWESTCCWSPTINCPHFMNPSWRIGNSGGLSFSGSVWRQTLQHWCDRLSCRHNKLCSGPENESPSRYKKLCSFSVNSCNSRVMSNWLCFTPKRSEQSGELYTDWCKDHVVELTANDMVAHFTILLS